MGRGAHLNSGRRRASPRFAMSAAALAEAKKQQAGGQGRGCGGVAETVFARVIEMGRGAHLNYGRRRVGARWGLSRRGSSAVHELFFASPCDVLPCRTCRRSKTDLCGNDVSDGRWKVKSNQVTLKACRDRLKHNDHPRDHMPPTAALAVRPVKCGERPREAPPRPPLFNIGREELR